MMIEGIPANLDPYTTYQTYALRLKMGEVSIVEKMTIRKDVKENILTVWIDAKLPATFLSSVIGAKIDVLLSLPSSIHPIIAGRTILGIEVMPNTIAIKIESDPA